MTELIDLCGRLPLALSIAAAQGMTRARLPLTAIAAGLRDAASLLAALDTGEAATSPQSVFSWSYQSLSDPAARMFRLLGLHVASDFSVQAAASLAGADAAESAGLLS